MGNIPWENEPPKINLEQGSLLPGITCAPLVSNEKRLSVFIFSQNQNSQIGVFSNLPFVFCWAMFSWRIWLCKIQHSRSGELRNLSHQKWGHHGKSNSGILLVQCSMCCPPVISWFINPTKSIVISYLRVTNHSEIGVMFTNLASEPGPQIAPSDT